MLQPTLSLAAMFIAACLGAAIAGSPHPANPAAPSQLDYLVFASMADSQPMLPIAAYTLNR